MIIEERENNNSTIDKNYFTISKFLQQIEQTNKEVAELNKLYGKNYRLIKLEGFVNKYIKVQISSSMLER